MWLKPKTVARAAGIVALGNLALQALAFVYRILLSRYAGAEGLGVFRLASAVFQVLYALCLTWVAATCAWLTARYAAKQDSTRQAVLLRLCFGCFFLLLSLSGAVLLLFANPIAENLLHEPRCIPSFVVMLLCLALTGIENILKGYLNGLSEVQFSAVSEVGEQSIRTAAAFFLLSRFATGDYGNTARLIFWAMVISEIFSVFFLVGNFLRRKNRPRLMQKGFDRQVMGQFFSIGLPVFLTSSITGIAGAAGAALLPSRLMLTGMSHSEALSALGIVSGMAMPIILLPSALIFALNTALMPVLTAAHTNGQQRRVGSLISRALCTVGLLGLPATAVMLPLAPALCLLVFGQPLTVHYTLLLGIAAVCSYYQMVTAGLLGALSLQRLSMVTAVGSECIHLGLLYLLVPKLNIYGYLIAICIAAALAALANLLLLYAHSRFSLNLRHAVLVPAVTALTLYYCTKLCYRWFSLYWGAALPAVLSTVAAAALLYLLLLSLLGLHPLAYLGRRLERPPLLPTFFFF